MSSLSIRLDPETKRQARQLRARGVILSAVVRDAVHAAYAQAATKRRETRLAVLKRLDAAVSQEERLERAYCVSDAREARSAVLRRLSRKRPR